MNWNFSISFLFSTSSANWDHCNLEKLFERIKIYISFKTVIFYGFLKATVFVMLNICRIHNGMFFKKIKSYYNWHKQYDLLEIYRAMFKLIFPYFWWHNQTLSIKFFIYIYIYIYIYMHMHMDFIKNEMPRFQKPYGIEQGKF